MQWLFLLGLVTGMRTMTAIAVLCCVAAFGGFPTLDHTWASWTTKWIVAALFVCAAAGEYVYDVHPWARSRKELFPLLARGIVGGLTGALAATAIVEPAAGGAILGVMGALVGAWAGHKTRMWLAARLGRDLPAGLLESAVALLLALFAAHVVHEGAVYAVVMENGTLLRWTNVLRG